MAQLIEQFDATQVDPTQGAGQLPVGKHKVVIESSTIKQNKNKDGGYLELNLLVIEGNSSGETGAMRLNLYHSNEQTVAIARKQFSALCHSVGVLQIQDSGQLHGIPFVVEVGTQKNDPQYTEVKRVYDINGNEPGQSSGNDGSQQQQQQQNNNGGGFGQQQQQQQQRQQQDNGGGAPSWFGQQQNQNQNQQQQQQQNNNGGGQGGGTFTPPWGPKK